MKHAKVHILSTGQVARYCGVTAYSVANWIRAGRLKAQRTPGGQYRVDVLKLRRFMVENGWPTDELDADYSLRPHCWEFWQTQTPDCDLTCESCMVRTNQVLDCFTLHDLLPKNGCIYDDCACCPYYNAWVNAEALHGESVEA